MQRPWNAVQIGRRNLSALYAFSGISRLWFDGGLWVVYFQHKGLSLVEIGVLEAVLHLTAVVSDVPIGIFADRFGWKLSLLLSTIAGIAYTSICLLSNQLWLFAVAFAARGLQVTFTNGSDASIAYESAVWARQRERYLVISGRLFAISLVSMGVAEAVGGTLAHWSWAAVYIAFTLANIVSCFAVLFIKEPRNLNKNVREAHVSALTIARDAVNFAQRSRPFAKWVVMSTVLSGFTATFAFYGQSLLVHAGWGLVGLGFLTGIENGIGAFTSWMAHRVVTWLGEKRTMTVASLAVATGLLGFAFLPGTWIGVGYLVGSAADNLVEPIVDQGLNRIVPSNRRATLLSANSTGFSLFMIVGFPLFGAVAQNIGLVATARNASIVGALAIIAAVYWWRRADISNGEPSRVEAE